MSLSQKRRCLTATREARASSGLKHEYLLFIAGALVALLAGPALAQSPEVVREWDFVKGIQDWQPNQTAKVRQAADGIVVTTDGRDPQLLSPPLDIAPHDGDVLEVRMAASRTGDIQWFWATNSAGTYGGLSQEQSRTTTVTKGDKLASVRTQPFWSTQNQIIRLRFDLPEGALGVYRIGSIRVVRGPTAPAQVWRREYRLAVALPRIDVATTAAPDSHPAASDYTVAMWYFAAWEPEYNWDGWQQVAERAPWRIPLLYDSADAAERFNGIQFYRSSNRRVLDWHVHWMREHAVNLMLWDWYPGISPDGSFDPTFFGNRALEVGFLGKEKLGGPPVRTNRFADTMRFAVMWTNHEPYHKPGKGLAEYLVDQFLMQPNYYRMDGRPLVPLWSPRDLVAGAGGTAQARAALDHLRACARSRGLPEIYVAAVTGATTREQMAELGIDGAMGYNVLTAGGASDEYRRLGERVIADRLEDFSTQTVSGHEETWSRMAEAFGRDYLLATCPMQNWEPTFRPTSYIMVNNTPDAYRDLLRKSKEFVERRGLRKFVTIEAWNEWLEGSYVEPSTQWGLAYLDAIRDVFARR